MGTKHVISWITMLVGLCSSCGYVKVSSPHTDTGIPPRDHAVQKLIATEYDSTHEDYRYFVVSYNFKEGHFVSKDTLFGWPKSLFVSLHQGRYLVSYTGPVYDIVEKKVISEPNDGHNFVEARGDTLFYADRRLHPRNRTYYGLDLKTLRYTRVPGYQVNYHTDESDSPLRFSPDNQKAVYPRTTDASIPPRSDIVLQEKNQSDTTIIRQVQSATSYAAVFPRVEIFWLDSVSFLYDDHRFYRSADNKGYHEVAIRRYDSRTGSDRLLCRIDSAERRDGPSGVFRRDAIGQLHYRVNSGVDYLLDTVGARVYKDPFFYLNADFSYTKPLGEGMTIRYRDSILVDNVWASTPVATDYDIACLYWEDPQPGRYKGVKIWTGQTGDWMTFDVPWPHELVGWVEE